MKTRHSLDQGSADFFFSVKGQMVNVFGSASVKTVPDTKEGNGCGYVSIKLYL